MIGSVSTDWQAAARPGARIGHAVEVHHELGSTNDRARELVDEAAADGIAVVAEVQSAGRGRRGRSWTSPPGVNLTVSVGLRPGLAAEAAGLLIPAAGLAAHAACASVAEVGLKWPNDVVAPDGRKVGGLLVEVASEGDRLRHAVVGVGLNVNWARADLPDELRATATSLCELAGRPVDRVALLRRLLEALEAEVDELEQGRSPIPRYRAVCRTLGARVTVDTPTGSLVGRALDVDEDGALVVEADGARVAVTNGEVVRVRAGSGA
jgi:BirA family biotin operon repressor/biotin-[acetyl-CoA-carboxylase] ligase